MSKQSNYQAQWFHERLMVGLAKSGLSVADIARRARISKSHAYRIFYELQWPSVPVMLRLEAAMGMEQGELVARKKVPLMGLEQ